LCIGAAVIWMSLAVLFGYLSAVHAGRFTDRALTILSLVGISMPVFWLAAILLYFLTFKVQLFPTGSYVPLTEDPLQWAYHLILPWCTLAVLYVGFYSRMLRSNMLDAMNEDYVRTARAKGLSERQVRIRHVLRNSMIPVITLFGLDFGMVVGGGAILTETVYNLDGVGLYAGEAIRSLDLPPLIGVTLFGAFFIVLFNTIVDIAYAVLDPRIRLGEAAPA
jgi:peptide/nickel transport system permease protein